MAKKMVRMRTKIQSFSISTKSGRGTVVNAAGLSFLKAGRYSVLAYNDSHTTCGGEWNGSVMSLRGFGLRKKFLHFHKCGHAIWAKSPFPS